MIKKDLWCGYCGCKEFIEHKDPRHQDDSRYSSWECCWCHAQYEDNPGYGYFTSFWGVDANRDKEQKYSLNTGELIDDTKLPRTPEGIVRHSGNRAELLKYLERTQIK